MISGQRFSALRQDAVIIGVLTLPFLLNDFANIFVGDYRVWLLVDYALVKALPLGVILYLLRVRTISVRTWALSFFGLAGSSSGLSQ